MTIKQFIEAWNKALENGWNMSQLARSLNLTRQGVSIKAIRLRAKGYGLPPLDRTRINK